MSDDALCALCLRRATLRDSHVLANALFKRLKQKSGPQLIAFDDAEDSAVQRSQKSWHEKLLCGDCEALISTYERYGLELIRGKGRHAPVKHPDGITFPQHDYRRFKLFVTSILWRAAVSQQEAFSAVRMPPEGCEEARLSVLKGEAFGPLKFGVRTRRLTDRTAVENPLSDEQLRNFIVSPMVRPPSETSGPYFVVILVLEGFMLECFLPRVPFRMRDVRGLQQNTPTFFAPFICFTEVSELMRLFATALGKSQRGLVKI